MSTQSRTLAFTEVNSNDPTVARIVIDDRIGRDEFAEMFGGSPGTGFQEVLGYVLDNANRDLVIDLNSPGGYVDEGMGIYNALIQHVEDHKRKVTVNIYGEAASIATIIACAATTIRMGTGAQMMIHQASGGVMGRADEIEAYAKTVRITNDQLAEIYAWRSNGKKPRSYFNEILSRPTDTWFSAKEALEIGLCDEIIEMGERELKMVAMAQPGATTKHSKGPAPKGNIPRQPSPQHNNKQPEAGPKPLDLDMSKVAEKLNLNAHASEAAIVAEIEKVEARAKAQGEAAGVRAAIEQMVQKGQLVVKEGHQEAYKEALETGPKHAWLHLEPAGPRVADEDHIAKLKPEDRAPENGEITTRAQALKLLPEEVRGLSPDELDNNLTAAPVLNELYANNRTAYSLLMGKTA